MNTATTNPETQRNSEIAQYLLALRTQLAPMTLAEREEILREIAAHIQDSVAPSADQPGESAAAVIARLGSPHDLAAQYNEGLLLRRATRSFSPLLLLRATLRYASKGVTGVLVFFAAVIGYSIGAGLVLTGLFKPISPTHTGLWVANGHLIASGTTLYPPASPAHEILGWLYIPVALILGLIVCAATTLAIRGFLKLSRAWQHRLTAPAPAAFAHI